MHVFVFSYLYDFVKQLRIWRLGQRHEYMIFMSLIGLNVTFKTHQNVIIAQTKKMKDHTNEAERE